MGFLRSPRWWFDFTIGAANFYLPTVALAALLFLPEVIR